MDRFGGSEHKLYGGYKKVKQDKVDIKDATENKTIENNILLDTSVQRLMKKNKTLQKQLNELSDQNTNLKNKNSVLERQVAKLKNKCLNLNII